ncbi:unnamed protein product [Linum tenue]|uniref:DYW domain-containing protein n=1 Tax=Linum tenue TaxID=586396 RepID=A0AAV0MRU7_9ROSI|nr:unnamed protein product [Linum tenue]
MLRTPSTFPKVPPFHGETVFSLREACKQGNLREAVSTFTASLTEDRTSLLDNPDEAYAPLLELCAKSRASSLGRQVHAHVLKFGVATPESVFLSTKLVFMYGKCGYVCDSQKVFDKMSDRTIFTWNAMMGAYVSNGKNLEALELYRQIRVSGSPLDSRTFPCALKACGALGDRHSGFEMHGLAIKCGCASVAFVANAMVAMYAKCKDLDSARKLFERMNGGDDDVLWNSMISAYSETLQYWEALVIFKKMRMVGVSPSTYTFVAALQACQGSSSSILGREIHAATLRSHQFLDVIFNLLEAKDNITWNSMLAGFIQNGLFAEALQCFHDFQDSDRMLQNTLVDVYGECGQVDHAARMFELIEDKDAISWTSMISSCINNGYAVEALEVFHRNKNLVTWTTMITAYGIHGHGKKAVELFGRIEDRNLIPDHITFLALLYACSHSMKCKYQLEPWQEHYVCLVDLLGRVNRLEEAYQFVKNMAVEPAAEVWCALLGACRVHSNEELGEKVAKKLLELNPKNPGNHVLVSNLFAAESRWNDVRVVRMRMKAGEEEKVEMLHGHSERLAIAYGLLSTSDDTPIRITKNLRICEDCHAFCKLVSRLYQRELVVRDASRFHCFQDGFCSCADLW